MKKDGGRECLFITECLGSLDLKQNKRFQNWQQRDSKKKKVMFMIDSAIVLR